jgi:hypothetical protein
MNVSEQRVGKASAGLLLAIRHCIRGARGPRK